MIKMKRHMAWALGGLLLYNTIICVIPKSLASNGYPTEGYVVENILLVGQETTSITNTEKPTYVSEASPATIGLPSQGTVDTSQMPQLPFATDRFYLFLNKANCQLTIYFADKDGNRSEFALCSITVAIGKRTTPTPSGTFTLGEKERWHYFGPSYAPYAIEFMPGRYLHGPLYSSARDSAVKVSLLGDFGKLVTGGCIRIPVDDARWIYENCPPGTYLEIVNGG